MVRCLGVILVLALLLCGCVQDTAEPTAPTDDSLQSGVSASTGLYVPNSDMEKATDGAVRTFSLAEGECYDAVKIDDELLLLYNVDGEGELVLYRGQNLEKVKSVRLGKGVLPVLSQIQINEQGIGYYDAANRAVVFLSPDFVEKGRVYLPLDMIGDGWLSSDWSTVHYCTANGVYAMNLQTGISRALRVQDAFYQELTGSFADGKVLRYVLELTEGQKQTLLIDGTTGSVIQTDGPMEGLIVSNGRYFLPQIVSGVRQLRFGTEEKHEVLWPAENTAEPTMLFDNNAIVLTELSEGKTAFYYYNLQTGYCSAAITAEGLTEVWGLQGDGEAGVWFLASDEAGNVGLYHWNSQLSPMENTKVYTEPLYTLEVPDTVGLERIKNSADALSKKLGIQILVWQDAVASVPTNQAFAPEYRTHLYDHYLARLEQAMSVFPQNMLEKFDGLQIALVQEITGDPSKGTLAEMDCMQFWKGNVPVVVLTLGDDFERNLYHGVYLYMEARLLSKSSALYEWYRLNPTDFDYDNSYITNLDRTGVTYIETPKPYFIDLFSMSYAKEDRATIFEYACMPGNEKYFEATVLQEKLRRICKGIREAYGLKKVETEFLWEQYLTE